MSDAWKYRAIAEMKWEAEWRKKIADEKEKKEKKDE
jgi:hypothetical protein